MRKKGERAKVKAEGGSASEEESDEGEEGSDEDEANAAQVFHDLVKEKADIGQVTGEAVCTIPEVLCLTPRGRFGAFRCFVS